MAHLPVMPGGHMPPLPPYLRQQQHPPLPPNPPPGVPYASGPSPYSMAYPPTVPTSVFQAHSLQGPPLLPPGGPPLPPLPPPPGPPAGASAAHMVGNQPVASANGHFADNRLGQGVSGASQIYPPSNSSLTAAANPTLSNAVYPNPALQNQQKQDSQRPLPLPPPPGPPSSFPRPSQPPPSQAKPPSKPAAASQQIPSSSRPASRSGQAEKGKGVAAPSTVAAVGNGASGGSASKQENKLRRPSTFLCRVK